MSSIVKVFLLLTVIVCISKAQQPQHCLCRRVRNGISLRSEIKDIQVYTATTFCNTVEIVVTTNSGLRYCLNPKLKAVQRLLASMMKLQNSTTATPTELTSTSY